MENIILSTHYTTPIIELKNVWNVADPLNGVAKTFFDHFALLHFICEKWTHWISSGRGFNQIPAAIDYASQASDAIRVALS